MNFQNEASEILKIRPLNITLLQKTKGLTNSKNYLLVIGNNQYNIVITAQSFFRK